MSLAPVDLGTPVNEIQQDVSQRLSYLRVFQLSIIIECVLCSGHQELWLVDSIHIEIDQNLAQVKLCTDATTRT